MSDREVGETLRKVAELRRLCVRLPHLETQAERRRLRRFEELVAEPGASTTEDTDALADGWSRWWRRGEPGRILWMAALLPNDLVAQDRRLASLLEAARVL